MTDKHEIAAGIVEYKKSPNPKCDQCGGSGVRSTGGYEPVWYDCSCTYGEAIPVERVREVLATNMRRMYGPDPLVWWGAAIKQVAYELGINLEQDDG